MKLFTIIVACLCLVSCSTHSPRKTRQIAVPVPGGGAKVMTVLVPEPKEEVRFRPSAARLVVLPWRYALPQGTTPSNWWWNVEHSFDGRNWSVLFSNVSVIPIIETTNKLEYFRLVGRL
jgi:hypothetical protein